MKTPSSDQVLMKPASSCAPKRANDARTFIE